MTLLHAVWITESERIMDLSTLIRDVEDYPKPGILFRDITPLLANGEAMRHVTKAFADYAVAMKAEAIAGIEARGFIFACGGCTTGFAVYPSSQGRQAALRMCDSFL